MAEAAVSNFTRENAAKWLANLGVACSGTKEELISRIRTFKKISETGIETAEKSSKEL